MSNSMLNEIDSCNSLFTLLDQYEVRIPIIQRDYAQGRSNDKAKEVRKRLLDDIIHAWKTDKGLDFNFVYGNRTDKIFYPVDGQQRLTTLYLLHWFLACRTGEDELLQFNKLNKFSYMTRNSASEFFSLLKNPNQELISMMRNTGNLIETITDYAWFRAEWHNDPTVISALNMLNDMCNREEFKNNEADFYRRLIAVDSPIIYFKVLIESGETTDSAETAAAIRYIRMNARGKVLTTFENVKAMLDGIDEKLQDKSTKIILDYDKEFIDIFYNKASGDMDEKTEAMDRQTMCFFRNMYNVAAVVHNKTQFDDDTNYANEMYRYSQGNLTSDEQFFSFYFNIMEAVLRVRKTEIATAKFIDAVFDEKFTDRTNNMGTHKGTVACFLYLYHLYIKHLKSKESSEFCVLIERIEKFDYVLKNLMYDNWTDKSFAVVNKLAEGAADATDIFDYFESNSPDTMNGFMMHIGLSDISQRVKEQHIKARIIRYKNYRYNIFHELEERFQYRKIQYLLWISGLWADNVIFDENGNDTKMIVLEKYMDIASRYYQQSNVGEDNIDWRVLFAIGGNWDEGSNGLLDSETINKNTSGNWEKWSHWNDHTYFWDDTNKPDEDKLNIVKRTYNLISSFGEDELINQVKIHLNDTCWLKYAVMKKKKELLTTCIRYSNGYLEICVNNIWKRFMPYVLLLEKKLPIEVKYRLQNLYKLDSQYSYSGFGICRFEKTIGNKVIPLEPNKTYRHTNAQMTHSDWRNFNITLDGITDIKFGNVSVNEDTIFVVNNGLYEVYQYQKDSNDFIYYFYSLAEIKKDSELKSLKIKEEYKEIMSETFIGNFDKILMIKNGKDPYWKHSGGNTRTWRHVEPLEYQLNKGNNYKISI